MAPKPGDTIVARDVYLHSLKREPLRVVKMYELVTLELWDRAPLDAAPSGYCDPWWARDPEGKWWVVSRPRAGRTVRLDIVSYCVDDEVRMRLSSLRASEDVVKPMLRNMGYGRSPIAPYSQVGVMNPIVALLQSRIA